MDIFLAILQVIIIIGLPLLLLKFRNKKPIKAIGTVGAAYLCGIVIALIMFGINKAGANVSFNADIGEIGSHAAIGVAIPLLLFGTDFVALKRLSKRSLGSFGLLTVSVIAVSVCACFAFASVLDDSGKLAGMATGLYTGGTPNLNAIGSILGVAQEIIAVSNLSDMLIGGIFYVFLLTLCKPLLSKILKKLYAAKDSDYELIIAKKGNDNIIRLLEKIKTINPSNRAYDEYFSEEEIAIFDNFLTYFNLADFGIIGSK